MNAIKCKWKNNADSAVLFMIDDLANAWVDINGNQRMDEGESWGYASDYELSPLSFLEENLFNDFPKIKATFFVPVARVPETNDYEMMAHFASIKENKRVFDFFHKAAKSPKYEMAYHGLTHGISGNKEKPFIQEWESYTTIEEALEAIHMGKEIFCEVFGYEPRGGKYCGYKWNSFSDESIDKTGFHWWCRNWSGELTDNYDEHGADLNYELSYFGNNRVIDMPSNIVGNMFNFIEPSKVRSFIKKILGMKVLLKEDIFRKGCALLDELIKNRQIISIQEHTSPARTDGKRQIPNIYDDIKSLRRIFSHLKNKNLWYATGTEIAEYFELYSRSTIRVIDNDSFEINYDGRNIGNKDLYVKIQNEIDIKNIITPDGRRIPVSSRVHSGKDMLFQLPVMDGIYKIMK